MPTKKLVGKIRSLAAARKGFRNSHDVANCMSALMSDVIQGNVSAKTANALSNKVGKLLRDTEKHYKPATLKKARRH